MKIGFTFIFLLLCLHHTIGADLVCQKQDSLLYDRYIKQFEKESDLPINELLVKTSLYFRETPYVASTLDQGSKEQLVINLREFDCTTFVETCIALSRTVKTKNTSFANFCKQLEIIRYRQGHLTDYASRLHYMTDWIYDNAQKNIIVDKTKDFGGVSDNKVINFMSTHSDAYPTLKNNQEQKKNIEEIELNINKRDNYNYIRPSELNEIEHLIKDGDIVVFATSIAGLDYSHVGIAYHDKGRLTFIHASTKSMKVIIEPLSLLEYCSKSKKCLGISVLRPNNKKRIIYE